MFRTVYGADPMQLLRLHGTAADQRVPVRADVLSGVRWLSTFSARQGCGRSVQERVSRFRRPLLEQFVMWSCDQ